MKKHMKLLTFLSMFLVAVSLTGCKDTEIKNSSSKNMISKNEKTNDEVISDNVTTTTTTTTTTVIYGETNNNKTTSDIKILEANYDKSEYGFHNFSFVVMNNTDKEINLISLNVNLMDDDGNIISSTYPQNHSRLSPGQKLTMDALAEIGLNASSAVVDGYSYYCGDEHVSGYVDESPEVFFDSSKKDTVDGIFNENNNENDTSEQESKVYQAYTTATKLTKYQLTKTNKGYSYNGLDLLSEDCDWIDDSLNKDGTVNQGAIYRKIAKLLKGIELYLADYTDFSDILLGFTPDTRDEFIPYADNASTFITLENNLQNIMKKFESLNCVKGNFDYEFDKTGRYSFTIKNLSKCAKEMQISEEMLGYIFALLEEYAPEIQFKDNKCIFNYKWIDETETTVSTEDLNSISNQYLDSGLGLDPDTFIWLFNKYLGDNRELKFIKSKQNMSVYQIISGGIEQPIVITISYSSDGNVHLFSTSLLGDLNDESLSLFEEYLTVPIFVSNSNITAENVFDIVHTTKNNSGEYYKSGGINYLYELSDSKASFFITDLDKKD